MAGILANSASVTMVAGTPDNINGGYVTNEAVTLTTEPAGGAYSWSLSKPSGATALSNLTSDTGASVNFIPDTHGIWVAVCIVDGSTVYILRVGVSAIAITTHANASVYMPIANNSVPTPALGATIFYSLDDDRLSVKLADGTVEGIDTTP